MVATQDVFQKSPIEDAILSLIGDPSKSYSGCLLNDLVSALFEQDKIPQLASLAENREVSWVEGQVQGKFLKYLTEDGFLYRETPSGSGFDAFTRLRAIVPFEPRIDAETISGRIDFYLDGLVSIGLDGSLRMKAALDGSSVIERTLGKIRVLSQLQGVSYDWGKSAQNVQKAYLAIVSHMHFLKRGGRDKCVSELKSISSIEPEWQTAGVQKVYDYCFEKIPHSPDAWLSYILEAWEITGVKPEWSREILRKAPKIYNSYAGRLWPHVYRVFNVKPGFSREKLQEIYHRMLQLGEHDDIAAVKSVTAVAPEWSPTVVHEAYWNCIQPRSCYGPGSKEVNREGVEQIARTTGMRFSGQGVTRRFFYEGSASPSTAQCTLDENQRKAAEEIMASVFGAPTCSHKKV